MASDINRVNVIGRLVRDPELRYTQSGTAVASFSIANNRTYSVAGEKKDVVSYFNCTAWSKLGEIITEYVKKGNRLAVEGRLQQRSWQDKDDNKRSTIEIVVENFQFLSPKESSNSYTDDKPNGNSFDTGTDVTDNLPFQENPFSDDDIPY